MVNQNTLRFILMLAIIAFTIFAITLGMIVYNRTEDEIKLAVDKTSIGSYDALYESYGGNQSGYNIKQLLIKVSNNNQNIYAVEKTMEGCVAIRSNSQRILNKIHDLKVEQELDGTSKYGVRYPEEVMELVSIVSGKSQFRVSFSYNRKTKTIGEIWIDDV